jgi:hypothetical protein
MKLTGVRRGGQADVNSIKVAERRAMAVVDGAMALVGDDKVKVGMTEAVRPQLARDGVER